VKPPVFDYHHPESVEEAVGLLDTLRDDEVKVLAGGQSLVPLMNFRLAVPQHLVDVNGLGELAGHAVADGVLRLGALTRHHELERSAAVRMAAPLLTAAAPFVGHVQIRSMGTLGGSLAHADPAAELPSVVLALDATLVARSVRGERRIPAAEFFISHFTTALEPDELLVAVEVPVSPSRSGHAFLEVAARHGDFALAAAAAAVTVDADGVVVDARIACASVAATPVRLAAAEELLRGTTPGPEVLAALESAVAEALHPTPELKASAAYKRRTAGVLAGRAVHQAWRVAQSAEAHEDRTGRAA
jgi:carbon-monoxide dehydrogenase medium subunit